MSDHLLYLQEEEAELELQLEADEDQVEEAATAALGIDPFVPSTTGHWWLPEGFLGIALRFAVLLVGQTAVAVLFFGCSSFEEKGMSGEQGKEVKVGRLVGDHMEFERKVLEIRAMAKEARERERKDLATDESEIKEEMSRRLDTLRKRGTQIILDDDGDGRSSSPKDAAGKMDCGRSSSQRKVGFFSSNAKSRTAPKGFSGLKINADHVNGGTTSGRTYPFFVPIFSVL